MNYKTSTITKSASNYNPGICKIFLIPINLLPPIETNGAGVFVWPPSIPPSTFANKNIVELDIVKQSLLCSEKPKDSKAGQFQEVKIAGRSNKLDPAQILYLTSLSIIPVQTLVFFSKGVSRIFGESDRGLDFSFAVEESNSPRQTDISIQLTGQSKYIAPSTTLLL